METGRRPLRPRDLTLPAHIVRAVLWIGLASTLGGLSVYHSWNSLVSPLLHQEPWQDLGRTILRASELMVFVALWRAIR
jgi:hypothetical protein